MYYPRQIPYLLNNEFKKYICYKEYEIEEISDYCFCIWTMKSNEYIDKTIYNYILPDACIDIVINFTDGTIECAGFSKNTIEFELNNKIDYMGVRLKPSAFFAIFNIGSDKIMDKSIALSDIDTGSLLKDILDETDNSIRLSILKNYLIEKIKHKPSMTFIQIVEQLYDNPKEQTVLSLAKMYGYNERQLYRIFKMNYGVSPRVLLNILRLHLCICLLIENEMKLVDIANICGFYDQSHFIKEIKRYTNYSPLQFLNYK